MNWIFSVGSQTNMLVFGVLGTYLPMAMIGVSYFILLINTALSLRQRSSPALQRRMEISRTLFLSFIWQCCTAYPLTFVITFAFQSWVSSVTLALALKWLSNSYGAINPVFMPLSVHCSIHEGKKAFEISAVVGGISSNISIELETPLSNTTNLKNRHRL